MFLCVGAAFRRYCCWSCCGGGGGGGGKGMPPAPPRPGSNPADCNDAKSDAALLIGGRGGIDEVDWGK